MATFLRAQWPRRPKRRYSAPMSFLDFERGPEAARREINTWVAEQTKQRIRDLIPAGGFDSLTRLVMVNAIYLKSNASRLSI